MQRCDYDYFNKINSLLADPNTPLPIILKVENFRGAFRKENTKLCQYILLHITEFVDYAFGLIKNNNSNLEIQSNALYALTTQSSNFSKQLTTNRTYLLKLMSFIKDDEPSDEYILTTFCFIFQFMIKLTDGFIFIHLPEKDKFISRLATHIMHNSIFDFLIFLSTSQNQVVIDYITNSQAVMKLLSSIDEKSNTEISVVMNKRIFQILTNISKNTKTTFLPNQISRKHTIKSIISYCIQKRCSNGFLFLSYVCDFFRFKKISVILPQIIHSLSNDICDFITDTTLPFIHSKQSALSLLTKSINSEKKLTDKIIEMASQLWTLFFENPCHSILHNSFLNFINVAASVDLKIIDKIKIREKIVDAYEKRDKITATYWGHLHLISAIVLRSIERSLHKHSRSQFKIKSKSRMKSESYSHSSSQFFVNTHSKLNELENLPEFTKYINDTFTPIESFLSTGYGGNLPQKVCDNDSSSSSFYDTSSTKMTNSSILRYLKSKFRNTNYSNTNYYNDSDSYSEKEEEEEEEVESEVGKNKSEEEEKNSNKSENESEDEKSNEEGTDNDDESYRSSLDESESDGFFNLYDFEQRKASHNTVIKTPISLKLEGNLFVSKIPKKIVFGPGGLIIGIASDLSLEIFKLSDFSRIKTRNFDTTLLSFSFSEDESQYFCCFFNKIIVFNLVDSTMSRAYCIEKANRIVMHDTSTRFCTFHEDKRIRAFKLPQNIEIASYKSENNQKITVATFSIDGRYLIVGYESGLISLFDLDVKRPPLTVAGSQYQITSICFDTTRNFLFSAAAENILKKWKQDEDSIKYEKAFKHNAPILAIDIRGNWIVSGLMDKTFSMTNIEENQICYTVKSHSSPILCVAFASYKEMFATASKDRTVKVWTFHKTET